MTGIDFSERYPDSYYAATAHARDAEPALAGGTQADVCVVGAGFTGVSTALHLAERGYDVVLLEAARVGWGASGRNGGQVSTGLRKDVLEYEPSLGREHTRALFRLALEAKSIIHERIARHDIRCDYRPGNLLAATRRRFLPGLEREVEHLARHYDYHELRMLDEDEVRAAVASEQYCGGRLDMGGGHLHPLNFLLGMADAARAAGVRIHETSRVESIRWDEPARVETSSGHVTARNVVLCGNAYLGGVEPRIGARVMPIANHVIATEPLGEAKARELIRDDWCVCATKHVVDYYRMSADHRLLFGGGETYSYDELPDIKGYVRRYMLQVFPRLADVRIDFGWSGVLCITLSRLPHFGRLGANGYFAQGFSGMGVALTQIAGKLLAEAVAGSNERFDVFARIEHRRFPGGTLMRKPLLVLGMLYFALRDRL
ncbi:MAG: FAD-binding oxidoreductase [Gammaproteobacteria bacterium]|nr:FAD-binding oxidoreductase [Gammaproteobacteria bacterium]